MIALSLAEIAAIVGGRLADADPALTVSGKVEFDSRKVVPGDLFLAIAGTRVDGHDYAGTAMDAGAVAVLASRPVPAPAILVADPIEAITALARAVARRLPASIIGITGSSGKTSTKDLLAQVLAGAGATVATPASFNNELGYPYTVLLADEKTQYLVLETSARGVGHIRHLTGIAAPRLATVLNVGSAHLSEFGSVETIALAKGELVEALPSAADGGVAVLNADDPRVAAMAARTRARVLTTGRSADADVRATGVTLDDGARARFTLVTGGPAGVAEHPVALQVVGEHQVANALSAAAAALATGMTPAAVATALSRAEPRSRWRMEVTRRPDGVTVVNDAYNANPESMRAALAALAGLPATRRVAVLGGMAELGADAAAEHERLGRDAVTAGVDLLVGVGPDAVGMVSGATAAGAHLGEGSRPDAGTRVESVPDRAAALDLLSEVLVPGDVVLVKASRSNGLEVLAADLLAATGDPTGAGA
jgi:UDP-N-acetylmuramoyl-tripeptide--D-alanyl-D-alanine ligase